MLEVVDLINSRFGATGPGAGFGKVTGVGLVGDGLAGLGKLLRSGSPGIGKSTALLEVSVAMLEAGGTGTSGLRPVYE